VKLEWGGSSEIRLNSNGYLLGLRGSRLELCDNFRLGASQRQPVLIKGNLLILRLVYFCHLHYQCSMD
jgi:hypothetical protein